MKGAFLLKVTFFVEGALFFKGPFFGRGLFFSKGLFLKGPFFVKGTCLMFFFERALFLSLFFNRNEIFLKIWLLTFSPEMGPDFSQENGS